MTTTAVRTFNSLLPDLADRGSWYAASEATFTALIHHYGGSPDGGCLTHDSDSGDTGQLGLSRDTYYEVVEYALYYDILRESLPGGEDIPVAVEVCIGGESRYYVIEPTAVVITQMPCEGDDLTCGRRATRYVAQRYVCDAHPEVP